MTGVDRGPSQDDREHGFAYSWWSDEQHVGGVSQIGARGEFPNQFLVDAGLCCEVEVFQLPAGGEVRQFEAGFPSALFGGLYLYSEQRFEELGVTGVVLSCLVEVDGERFGNGSPSCGTSTT